MRGLPAIALLALLASGGCKGELNFAYCVEHPDDTDCRSNGLAMLDAPTPKCESNAQCIDGINDDDPMRTICDLDTKSCVQCVRVTDEKPCMDIGQFCGADNTCKGCIVDSHCNSTSGVCLPSGSCALESSLLFVSPNGGDTAPCTKDMPCTLPKAVADLTAERHIIKMLPSQTAYAERPITIQVAFGVQIIGDGATFAPDESGDAILAQGPNLEIDGLTITGAQGSGVNCVGAGVLSVERMTVVDSTQYGIKTTGCKVSITRTRLSSNTEGGMWLSAGEVEVVNNIIDLNGDADRTEVGNVRLNNVSGRFVFNTVALNLSRSGGQRIGGLTCTQGAAPMRVARNILAENGDAGTERNTGTCDEPTNSNYVTRDVDTVGFASTQTFKLSAASPKVPPNLVLDDSLSGEDCKTNGIDLDDFEGLSRPVVYCDRGAYEFR